MVPFQSVVVPLVHQIIKVPLRVDAKTNAVNLLLDELLHDALFHIRNPKRLSCANQIANVLGIVQLAVHAGGQIQLTHG